MAVAIHAVRRGNVRLRDTVAIVGSGTIGLCVLLAARVAGASKVYVVDKIKRRGEIALAMGATAFINPDDNDPVESIANLTDGLGVDIARRNGTTVIVGVFDQPSSFHFQRVMFN